MSCCAQWSHHEDKMVVKEDEKKIPDLNNPETREIFALMAMIEEKYPTYKQYN